MGTCIPLRGASLPTMMARCAAATPGCVDLANAAATGSDTQFQLAAPPRAMAGRDVHSPPAPHTGLLDGTMRL